MHGDVWALVTLFLWPILAGSTTVGRVALGPNPSPPRPTPAAVPDPLAEPVEGEAPTQVETGRSLYYYHCMPCHGDRGQGLTDEWRSVWEEEHQNCWARGCHTGKSELTAFYIPHAVPAVSGSPQALGRFHTADELFVFLRSTQPPQRAGALSEEEYWALTAFLLWQNGRLPAEAEIGPGAGAHAVSSGDVLLATLASLAGLLAAPRLGTRRCKSARSTAAAS